MGSLVDPKSGPNLLYLYHKPTNAHFIYVKVKVSPEQATKAQKGNRIIALLFL
jgi:hypothetical protein